MANRGPAEVLIAPGKPGPAGRPQAGFRVRLGQAVALKPRAAPVSRPNQCFFEALDAAELVRQHEILIGWTTPNGNPSLFWTHKR